MENLLKDDIGSSSKLLNVVTDGLKSIGTIVQYVELL